MVDLISENYWDGIMEIKITGIAAALLVTLGACASEIEMPAASVTMFESGETTVMTGQLYGRLDGSSRTVLSGDGMSCEMEMAKQSDGSAAGVMNCTDANGQLVYSAAQSVTA